MKNNFLNQQNKKFAIILRKYNTGIFFYKKKVDKTCSRKFPITFN